MGDHSHDQGKVTHAFCPEEGRERGCHYCRFVPPEYKGLSPRAYSRAMRGQGQNGARRLAVEDLEKMGAFSKEPF